MKLSKQVVWIMVGVLLFPTVTMGGTFVASLIQGKTVEEAVQILAIQIDSLIGRVNVIERKQQELEGAVEINKNEVDSAVLELENELEDMIEENEKLKEELDSQATSQTEAMNRESACRKAQELKQAPPETLVAYISEAGPAVTASWAPNTTIELLDYLEGYMAHYNATGNRTYIHIPQYDPAFVPGYISILKTRKIEYEKQNTICKG